MLSIGVVIPCRDYGHFLSDALRSLVKQETALRVAIVNDGGSDGPLLDSLAGAFRTRDVTIDVLHMPAPRGVGLARNTGAAYLSTDFFLFLDADDWLYEGAVDALVAILRDVASAAFSYGNYTENGRLIETMPWDHGFETNRRNIASCCNLWRRDPFWRLGGYSSIDVAEDWEIQRRAALADYHGARTDTLIFEHRLHDKNKWTADAVRHGGMVGVADLINHYEPTN